MPLCPLRRTQGNHGSSSRTSAVASERSRNLSHQPVVRISHSSTVRLPAACLPACCNANPCKCLPVHHRSLTVCTTLSGRLEIKHGLAAMLGDLPVFVLRCGRRRAGLPLHVAGPQVLRRAGRLLRLARCRPNRGLAIDHGRHVHAGDEHVLRLEGVDRRRRGRQHGPRLVGAFGARSAGRLLVS